MRTSRRAAALSAALALTAGMSVAAAPAAFAGTAPSCISTSVRDGSASDTVTVTNNCNSAYRLKVIWAYDTDGPCTYTPSGYYFTSTRAYPARFDGVVTC